MLLFYSGKERVFLAIAEEFNCKIWAKPDKMKILRALEDNQLLDRLTNSPNNAQIHLMEMEKVRNFKFPVEYLEDFSSQYNHILSIIPTGWTHQKGSTSESSLQNMKIKTFKDNTSRLEIPYSEHSSFSELKRFVKFLKLQCFIKSNTYNNTFSWHMLNREKPIAGFWQRYILLRLNNFGACIRI